MTIEVQIVRVSSYTVGDRNSGEARCAPNPDLDSSVRALGNGKATKGTRWMPRRREAMKDVDSCEKPRVGANNRRSVDLRIGQPGRDNLSSPY